MMSASILQALQCNTSPRVHPPNYAPTLLRHRSLVSPPFTTAALDIGPMPLSHHVLQYRCVLLEQLQIWRVVTYMISIKLLYLLRFSYYLVTLKVPIMNYSPTITLL
jgi:hypothetical protein